MSAATLSIDTCITHLAGHKPAFIYIVGVVSALYQRPMISGLVPTLPKQALPPSWGGPVDCGIKNAGVYNSFMLLLVLQDLWW